jgi:amino-acid N-acetyltransferase
MSQIEHAHESDIPELVALNNRFAPQGLTLARSEAFAYSHLADYRVLREADGGIVGCVALDEYSPSIVELCSLAVAPDAQGLGHGKRLIAAAEQLSRVRGYAKLFAVSFSDDLFLQLGWDRVALQKFPEKISRYTTLDKTEIEVGEKHCFSKKLS